MRFAVQWGLQGIVSLVTVPDAMKQVKKANPVCKKAAYEYYKAVYKWIGNAIFPSFETSEDKLTKF